MAQLFTNNVALVTGRGSGIGRAIAESYAKEGANVVIAGRRDYVLKEAADENDAICYGVADITKSEDVAKIAETIKSDFNG